MKLECIYEAFLGEKERLGFLWLLTGIEGYIKGAGEKMGSRRNWRYKKDQQVKPLSY